MSTSYIGSFLNLVSGSVNLGSFAGKGISSGLTISLQRVGKEDPIADIIKRAPKYIRPWVGLMHSG